MFKNYSIVNIASGIAETFSQLKNEQFNDKKKGKKKGVAYLIMILIFLVALFILTVMSWVGLTKVLPESYGTPMKVLHVLLLMFFTPIYIIFFFIGFGFRNFKLTKVQQLSMI